MRCNDSAQLQTCREVSPLSRRPLWTFQFSFVWVPRLKDIELLSLAEQVHSPIELGMSLIISVKLAIGQQFFRDANLSCTNEESCSIARPTWSMLNRKRNKRLLKLDRKVISITVDMLTCHCLMGIHAESVQLRSTEYCSGYGSAEDEENVIPFSLQMPISC